MPQSKSGPTSSHWEKLDKILNHSTEPFEPGWFTTEQYAEHYNLGSAAAYRQCVELMKCGILECWFGVSFVNRRKMRKWRLTDPKERKAASAAFAGQPPS